MANAATRTSVDPEHTAFRTASVSKVITANIVAQLIDQGKLDPAAARSTGPRSPEGKARSSQNARKHQFTGLTFAVVRLEDLQEIARLRDELVLGICPKLVGHRK